MARQSKPEEPRAGAPEWMATYSDLVTLLFCFFVLLYALSQPDPTKLMAVAAGVQGSNSSLIDWSAGASILESMSSGIPISDQMSSSGANGEKTENQDAASSQDAGSSSADDSFQTYNDWGADPLLGNVVIEATNHSIKFRLGDMLFDSGRDEIRPEANEVLRKIADLYNNHPQYADYDIVIQGHTDNVPINTVRFPDNWDLSAARAISIGRFFINECGIDPHRITTTGYGEQRPVAPNDTPEGRQQNRRVEIEINKVVNNVEEITS